MKQSVFKIHKLVHQKKFMSKKINIIQIKFNKINKVIKNMRIKILNKI